MLEKTERKKQSKPGNRNLPIFTRASEPPRSDGACEAHHTRAQPGYDIVFEISAPPSRRSNSNGRGDNVLHRLFIAGALLLASHGSFAQHLSEPDELQIGPVNYIKEYQGISLTVPVTIFFKATNSTNTLNVALRVVADLADLQQKTPAIVAKIDVPRNNCRSYSANNPVVSIDRAKLSPHGSRAVLSLGGSVEGWDCRENPIPNSKVEWVNTEIGFGIKTKVPRIVTWPGNPIKNKYITQPLDVDIPARVVSADGNSVQLVLETPTVKLGGQFAFITEGILKIAGVNINDEAKKLLDRTIDPSILRQTIPDDIKSYNPKITSIGFGDDAGRLILQANMSAEIPGAAITDLLKLAVSK